MDTAIEVISSLSELYMSAKDFEKEMKVSADMDKLIDEYAAESEPAREHLNVQPDAKVSEASDALTIDLAQKLNICNYLETCQKQTAHEANEQNQIIKIHENTPFVSEKILQNSGYHGTSVATCTVGNYKRNLSDEQP